MTSTSTLEWLRAEFEQAARHRQWKSPDRHRDPHWHGGPSVIRPMIQLRAITHGGTPMTVTYADYADPE